MLGNILNRLRNYFYSWNITVTELLEGGAEVNEGANIRNSLLHEAARNGRTDVVRALNEWSVDMNATDKNGKTPMHLATLNGHTEALVALLEGGADMNTRGRNGNTLLHDAASRGHREVVRMLLTRGADVHARDNYGDVPLRWASWCGRTEVVKILIESGADVNASNKHGETPLRAAVINCHTETVRVLLEKGADLNARDAHSYTALHWAAQTPQAEAVVRVLLLGGAGVDTRDRDDNTPLHMAVFYSRIESVRVLLEWRADVNARNKVGHTLLHRASHIELVRVLLEKGAEVSARDINGNTPLHGTVFHGRTEIARVLIDAGADIHAINNDGETPIVRAFEQGHHNIVQLLEERGAQLPEHLRDPPAQPQGFRLNNHQSTHTASVHKCVSESTLALSGHYQGKNLNKARVQLLQWVKSLTIEQAELVRRSISRLIALDYIDPRSNISIRDALALVWLGINDIEAQKDSENPAERICFSMEKTRQENPTLTDEQVKEKFNEEVKQHITLRQERLINCLCETQREYNKSEHGSDKSACSSGSFNALIYVLHGGHAKVNVWYANNESVILRAFLLFKNQVESLPIELKQKVASLWKAGKDDWLTEVFALQQFTNVPAEIQQALHDEFDSFNLRKGIIDETINNLVYQNFPTEFEPLLNAIKSEEPEIMTHTDELPPAQKTQILNQFSLEQMQKGITNLTVDEEGEKRATNRAGMH